MQHDEEDLARVEKHPLTETAELPQRPTVDVQPTAPERRVTKLGQLLCRWFGHRWTYQPEILSTLEMMPPARVCIRCQWRLCERLIDGEWVYDAKHSIDV